MLRHCHLLPIEAVPVIPISILNFLKSCVIHPHIKYCCQLNGASDLYVCQNMKSDSGHPKADISSILFKLRLALVLGFYFSRMHCHANNSILNKRHRILYNYVSFNCCSSCQTQAKKCRITDTKWERASIDFLGRMDSAACTEKKKMA